MTKNVTSQDENWKQKSDDWTYIVHWLKIDSSRAKSSHWTLKSRVYSYRIVKNSGPGIQKGSIQKKIHYFAKLLCLNVRQLPIPSGLFQKIKPLTQRLSVLFDTCLWKFFLRPSNIFIPNFTISTDINYFYQIDYFHKK